MDINVLRIGVTIAGLVLFLALVVWVYSARNRAGFQAAGYLPLLDDSGENKS
jgi:cbb3-type cytochrome oxidase subunit 3